MQRYMATISGPLMDRIDIHIDVPAVHYRDLSATSDGEPSAQIRQRVQQARRMQDQRFARTKHVFCNAHMTTKQIRTICKLDDECHALLEMAMDRLGLSARAYTRILKVSRTIADLAGSDDITPEHVSEAIHYRSLDRELWLQQSP
jgi:magnesium chelatase family protein